MNKTINVLSVFIIIILIFDKIHHCDSDGHIINPVRFPFGGPFMGLFVALALPLELDNYNVFVSYNFEGNYVLPANDSEYDYPPIVERSFNFARKFVYDALEHKLVNHGYSGKECLLRAICEASEHSMENGGVLADIIHIILTPSTSKSESLNDYESAEMYGKLHKHCKRYKKKCPFSVLNLISRIDKIL
ncbi:uncharacterized protein [Atheta coriaria]|uniref:uncharacterized protein n=1 Tax=Dalotia coriaria TaxID=877792 RepID=UPI0031F41435